MTDTTLPESQVSPQLLQLCKQVNACLIQYVGPIAPELCAESLSIWVKSGKRTRANELVDYINLLSAHIRDVKQRGSFIEDAHEALRRR